MAEILIILLGIAADQLSKAWVSANLMGRSVVIMEDILHYSYVENTGAAFGMLGNSTLILTVFSALMALMMGWILWRYRKGFHKLTKIALAFVIAGAVGNLIDRALYGFVVDFIEVKFVNFAVFNIADIWVCLGGALLLMSLIFLEKNNFEQFEAAQKKPGKKA